MRGHVRVPLPGVRRGGAAAGRLRPQPFRVRREALVEPDVAPVGDREAVAEPLVGQLVHDEPLVGAPPVEVVRPEDRHALGLDRVVQLVVGDDELVVGERVGPEEALQRRHDRGVPAEVVRGVLAQPGREQRHLWHRACGEHDLVVAPDLHADQVRRRGLRPLVHPGPRACRAAPRGEHTGGGDRVGRRGGDRDAVGRLVRRGGRCTGTRTARRRLARDERAVGRAPPSRGRPTAGDRCGVADVAHLDGEPARDRPGRRDVQLARPRDCVNLAGRPSTRTRGTRNADEVEAEPAQRRVGHGGEHRPSGEPVGRRACSRCPGRSARPGTRRCRARAGTGRPTGLRPPSVCGSAPRRDRVAQPAGRRGHGVAARDQGARPDVVPAPMLAPGRMIPLGPSVAPSSMRTSSMLMIRSWNRWVCTTQPRLTVAPSPRRTRSDSGSQ